jgi:hypothetical protein
MAGTNGYLTALLLIRRRRARPDAYRHGLGTVVAFLTGIFLVRYFANVYICIDLAGRRESIGLGTFLTTSIGILAVYGVTVLPISSYRYVYDAIHHPRFEMSPFTRMQKFVALTRDVFLRPFAAVVFATSLITAVLSEVLSTTPVGIVIPLLLFIATVSVGASLMIALVHKLRLKPKDCELLEIGLLIAMVLSNPDVRIFDSTAHLLFFLNRLPPWSPRLLLVVLPGAMFVATIAALLCVRGVSSLLSGIEGKRLAGSPRNMTNTAAFSLSLYVRRYRLWFWAVAYMVTIPIVVSSTASPSLRRWVLTALPILAFVGFLRFAAEFENEIAEKMRVPLKRLHRTTLFAVPFALHMILSVVPIVIWLISAR